MTRISIKSLLTITAALVVMVGLGSATAGQDDGRNDQRIRIEKKIISGDGEQKVERKHVVFIGEDGKTVEIDGGDGEGLKWIFEGDGEEAGHMKMMFIGEDGETIDFKGHDGKSFSWTSSEGGGHAFRLHEMGSGGFLGVGTTELTPQLRSHFGVPEESGVMVSNVIDDSGAFKAGVLVGDIVTAVDSHPIASARGLQRAIRKHEEGDAVTLEVWRDGQVQNITAIVGKTEGASMHMMGSSVERLHLSSGHPGDSTEGMHRVMMMKNCADEDGDCEMSFGGTSAMCGDQEKCEIKVSCEDDSCTCEVNGVESECEGLEGVHVRHHD